MVMCRRTEVLIERRLNESRRSLAARHLDLARSVVAELTASFPQIDGDELMSEAYLALSQAAERHSTPRHGPFELFASQSIRRRCLKNARAELRRQARFEPLDADCWFFPQSQLMVEA